MARMDTKSRRLLIIGGMLVALGLAFFVSPYASNSPDGLNKVAADKGFAGTQQTHATETSPLAGYEVRGVHGKVSTGIAGVIGVLVVLGIGMILFALVRKREPASPAQPATDAPSG